MRKFYKKEKIERKSLREKTIKIHKNLWKLYFLLLLVSFLIIAVKKFNV